MKTREEHLEWCKKRAREYLSEFDAINAIVSMLSDLDKHPETKLTNPYLTAFGMRIAADNDIHEAKRFIEGFQ